MKLSMKNRNGNTVFDDDGLAAWLAGLYEGEGSVITSVRTPSTGVRNLSLSIAMTDFDVIRYLPEITGMGTLQERPPGRPHYKPQLCWNVGVDLDVIALIERMLPWLGERRSIQALSAVQDYWNNRPITLSIDERFWSHVDKADHHWPWTGHIEANGFGTFNVGADEQQIAECGYKRKLAHRYAYEVMVKDVTGIRLQNNCGVKHCVKPDHWDVSKKWRTPSGDDHYMRRDSSKVRRGSDSVRAKLDEEKVRDIKRSLADGARVKVLAEEYEVSHATISLIRSGRRWSHVTLEAVDQSDIPS